MGGRGGEGEREAEVTCLKVYNIMPFSIVFLRWDNSHANNLISTPICTTNIRTSVIPGMNTTRTFFNDQENKDVKSQT